MTLRYVSKHHSEDDPGGLIHEAFAAGPEFTGPAEDLLLAWTLRLERGQDAPAAAARLLAELAPPCAVAPEGEAGRLLTLLRQTAAADANAVPRRRRGGRQGRIDGAGDNRSG